MKPQSENDSKIVEHYEKIHEFAQKEINRTFTVYKFLFSGIVILLTFGTALGTYLIGKSLSDIEKKYESKYEEYFKEAKRDVKERIDNEFKTDNIKKLVESVAQKRIDTIADKIIENQVSKKIIPIKQDVDDFAAKTSKNLEQLVFDYLELGVYNNSTKAFIQLYDYTLNDTCKFYKQAKEIIDNKVTYLRLLYSGKTRNNFGSVINVNVTDLDKLYNDYYKKLGIINRFYFLEEFWGSEHNKKDKTDFIARILIKEIDLTSAFYISEILNKELNLNLNPANINAIIKAIK